MIVSTTRLSTGIDGLDEILSGGLLPSRSYLLSGPPGAGKTTIGWHFLCEGARNGEGVLFISFGEAEPELRANARASGFDSSGVTILDLSPPSDVFTVADSYDVFHASEVEREPIVRRIIDAVDATKPSRVFVDSMSHLRYLANDNTQYRRQTLAFIRYLVGSGAAVMMTSEASAIFPDDDLRFLVDGVFELDRTGQTGRLTVSKFRGSPVSSGAHAVVLSERGARVFPRIVPESHDVPHVEEQLGCGIAEVDQMLHGGIERATITLITGPSGVGKTSLAVQFMKEAAARGERTAIYSFDERRETLLRRAELTNTPVRSMVERGSLIVTEIEALRYGPDEFANLVRADVKKHGSKLVMIDSVSGYRLSVCGEDLTSRLHALCKYLQNVGVTVILINELQELTEFRISDVNISYLADTVIFLRYLDSQSSGYAEISRAIGVLKKRLTDFDKRLYSFSITANGIVIGEPLRLNGGIMASVRVT